MSPFLKQGVIFAFLKLSGKIFELMLKLNIFVRGAAIAGELIFKKLGKGLHFFSRVSFFFFPFSGRRPDIDWITVSKGR